MRKSTTKTVNLVEDKKTPKKDRIRQIIKQPKEKFLTKNQEDYWRTLGENEITLCFGPAGVGKSYIASKISTNIRELEGALIRVTAFASLNRQGVDLSLAEIVLKDLIPEEGGPEITGPTIMAQTASYFSLTDSDSGLASETESDD